MKRRAFLLAAGGLLTPLAAKAQPGRMPAIGVLTSLSSFAYAGSLEALRQGLRELGYLEGRNLRLEARYAEGKLDRLDGLAVELGRVPVHVLVTAGSHVTRVARKSTRDIPIVMAYAGDPVGSGLVDSLSRPGGRITGLTTLSSQLAGKRLEILKETLPKLAQVGVVWNPNVPERVLQFKETQTAAKKLGISLHSFEARGVDEISAAMTAASGRRLDALIVLNDALLSAHLKRIVDRATAGRLPTLYQTSDGPELGGLMSYGPSFSDLHRRAAVYVDKILKGAKPGELPIEQPVKFELVVNLKTAKALGIAILRSMLVRADKVIE